MFSRYLRLVHCQKKLHIVYIHKRPLTSTSHEVEEKKDYLWRLAPETEFVKIFLCIMNAYFISQKLILLELITYVCK